MGRGEVVPDGLDDERRDELGNARGAERRGVECGREREGGGETKGRKQG